MSAVASHIIPPYAANFPSSTAQPSSIFPFPGVTPQSTRTVRRILEENDKTYDIWEKARFAHNHFPHSALTRYALGAPSKLLEEVWEHDRSHLVSLDPSGKDRHENLKKVPEKITRENWDDPKYLGVKACYSRYLVFFHEEIDRLGPIGALEEYILSPQANYASANGHEPPLMLIRFVGGLLHPMIHAGFGVEFKDRVILAEGLAQATNHDASLYVPLYGSDWPKGPRKGRSLLDLYGEMCASSVITPVPYDPDMLFNDRVGGALSGGHAIALRELVDQWSLTDEELSDETVGWREKVEELAVWATLLAGATGRTGKEPRVDFFLMHALTSSIFLPAYLEILSISNRRMLLKSYTLMLFVIALGRGRPKLNPGLVMSYDLFPVAPGTEVKASRETVGDASDKNTRNAWLTLIESSLYANGELSLCRAILYAVPFFTDSSVHPACDGI
ncbi:hypothetical protein TREMEDRAFT_28974 [Tremella mesenterica DSM 1558]|uniref:uncharacterized protein n=1 Tax=Tremella mesenterica (strain ATCC 24925 / CBS 8224 / DSM 1558 / NBRC 9311 / NRRL Y-6157 / RJB 2259-6 / UBC 559-6) TaxID=578456 RepID=UPI0003F49E5D|nr:uncharacterized protein TREMEDRAFT_28974 [Tremella mesenterica DSM 1558]EIW70851.1 hypothetical protein TREMEDRAFT_28974 [Tremella mesenterica DSM 1558]